MTSIHGHYLQIEPGVELYYEDRGSGQPVVFIPGWTFSADIFCHQVEHVAQHYRVVSYDPRSQGRSSVTMFGHHYAAHGADLGKLLASLNLNNVVLVGWSFGCLALLAYIRQHGLGNVRGVVLVDASPRPLSVHPSDWVEGPLHEIAAAYNTYVQSPQGQRDFVTYYATNIMVQRTLTPQELFWLTSQSLQTPYWVAALLFASGMFSDYMAEAALADANLPSLYIVAEHWSGMAKPFLKKHLPNTRVEALGGHMMFWEHPTQFNAILDKFLASL